MFESISGEHMLNMFHQQHHEHGINPDMEQFILNHDWGVQIMEPDEIPDYDHEVYYADPFRRIIDFDEDRIRWWRNRIRHNQMIPPIILGPDSSIIDGNHRAQAAKSLNVPIQAYVPMKQDEFVVEHMLNQFRRLAGMV